MTVGGQPLEKKTHHPVCRTLGGPQGQKWTDADRYTDGAIPRPLIFIIL